MLVAGISRDLVERGGDAVQWVRAAAAKVQGRRRRPTRHGPGRRQERRQSPRSSRNGACDGPRDVC